MSEALCTSLGGEGWAGGRSTVPSSSGINDMHTHDWVQHVWVTCATVTRADFDAKDALAVS